VWLTVTARSNCVYTPRDPSAEVKPLAGIVASFDCERTEIVASISSRCSMTTVHALFDALAGRAARFTKSQRSLRYSLRRNAHLAGAVHFFSNARSRDRYFCRIPVIDAPRDA
jgi:hypothetical protein